MSLRIAFAGLGIMGTAMVKNLLAAGFDVAVTNRTADKAGPLVAAGAAFAATPAEAAAGRDVLVLMLTGPEACDAVLFGPGGAVAGPGQGLGPGGVVVNMSTVPASYNTALAARLAARGATLVDAPVSGSKKPAEEGTLVILAGGPQEVVERLTPMFLAMGKKVVRCGETGAGSVMKVSVNVLLGTMLAGFAEMLRLGEAGGLDRRTMLDVVLAGPMANDLLRMKEPLFENDAYPAQFPAKHMAKDVKFAVDAAYETGAAAPCAHMLVQLYRRTVALGLGDDDFAAVIRAL
jgi:3-hydroxyisobutyrate dehydrogenase-like beta-hydroxyacid dehydrogenase